jgi:Winged helix-turn helix
MPRQACTLRLTDDEAHRVAQLARAPSTPQALAFRARLVLRCADDDRPTNRRIARELGCDPDTVCKWRGRFARERLDGLRDLPRSGRPRTFSPGGPPQGAGAGDDQTG